MGSCTRAESEVIQVHDEDEVCGVFHASHRVNSRTILAYLIAHRPDCVLAFVIVYPSPAVRALCDHVFAKPGLIVKEDCNGRLVGASEPTVWIRLLLDHGEYLESHSVRLTPVRIAKRPKL